MLRHLISQKFDTIIADSLFQKWPLNALAFIPPQEQTRFVNSIELIQVKTGDIMLPQLSESMFIKLSGDATIVGKQGLRLFSQQLIELPLDLQQKVKQMGLRPLRLAEQFEIVGDLTYEASSAGMLMLSSGSALICSHQSYYEIAANAIYKRDIVYFLKALKSNPLFNNIDYKKLRKIFELGKVKSYAKGQTIMKANELQQKVFFIRRGRFAVLQEGYPLLTLNQGQHYGLEQLLLNTIATHQVVCQTIRGYALQVQADQLKILVQESCPIQQLEHSLKDRLRFRRQLSSSRRNLCQISNERYQTSSRFYVPKTTITQADFSLFQLFKKKSGKDSKVRSLRSRPSSTDRPPKKNLEGKKTIMSLIKRVSMNDLGVQRSQRLRTFTVQKSPAVRNYKRMLKWSRI